MNGTKENLPVCFGELETVFPKGADGLRTAPAGCLACRHKTECLRAAMKRPCGLKAHEEFVDRAYDAGMLSFMQRWSRKKDLHRKGVKKR
ncbi:MAG: hypothetical protein MUP74_02125 [Desulfobacterales bacterium]|nr:hypothetical protein [Desulfobacterales bacterium]